MNEKDIKELIDRGDKTAFLLGLVTGGLQSIIKLIEDGLDVQAEEAIYKLFKDTMKHVDAIYYSKKDTNDH